MALSRQMRLLQNKWQTNTAWPKRLESLEIAGLRGWTGQRIDFRFPLMAICGENGSGKSTILQCAACAYNPDESRKNLFAADFFPDTAWEKLTAIEIRATVREGNVSTTTSVRKPTTRWRGYAKRRKRDVSYIDLSRIQPVSARPGYSRIAKSNVTETDAATFRPEQLARLAEIMGRPYATAKMALTNVDKRRRVPVVSLTGSSVSGFHQGAGELTMAEFLQIDPPRNSLVLIDEVETSLHPRAQRRLIRDLADMCRTREVQMILTTHSPYILGELPPEGRGYIIQHGDSKEVVLGVSPEFAMTQMDEEQHPEGDLFVEDDRAADLIKEILFAHARDFVKRVITVPYGAVSVGQALGQMVLSGRFPRPSLVFLDGDQPPQGGCIVLPGNDAPERVVFGSLAGINWGDLHQRTGREFAATADACSRAMTAGDHHEWVRDAANRLLIGSDVLWQAMCAVWANRCLSAAEATPITTAVAGALQP